MRVIANPPTAARAVPKRPWLTLLTLCLAVFVAQVDTAVVNLATRPIGEYFNASISALQWFVDSYNLVYAVLLLSGGLLADLYGRRRMFMAGAAIFSATSLLCALAPSMSWLIAGRALTGVGAALLLPASLSVIRIGWPDAAERGRALGIWAACNGLAMAISPTLGGLLIHSLGWRSIFVVVIPLGIAAIALAIPSIPESSDPHGRSFDAMAQLLGAVFLAGLACAAIALNDSPEMAAAALVIAGIALTLFIRVERHKGAAALVPLEIFRTPQFNHAAIATTGMTFGMYGVLFLLPLTWQSSGKFNPIEAGMALLPMALVFVLVSPLTGALSVRFGGQALSTAGLALIGSGLVLIGMTAEYSAIAWAECGLALTGLGMGLATGPLMSAAIGAVAPARAGTASALINVARMTGATLGVAVLGAVFSAVQGGGKGLHFAMTFGGLIQLGCAAVPWLSNRMRFRHASNSPGRR